MRLSFTGQKKSEDAELERFFRYSLEHNRPIRIMMMHEGKLRQVNAVIEKQTGNQLSLYILRPPQRITVSVEEVLSCDYAKNDEGF